MSLIPGKIGYTLLEQIKRLKPVHAKMKRAE